MVAIDVVSLVVIGTVVCGEVVVSVVVMVEEEEPVRGVDEVAPDWPTSSPQAAMVLNMAIAKTAALLMLL